MGTLSPRLAKMFTTVRAGAVLPIIVTTSGPVDTATLTAAKAAGAGPIRNVLRLGNGYATSGTEAVANRLAELPQTKQVHPDEVVIPL